MKIQLTQSAIIILAVAVLTVGEANAVGSVRGPSVNKNVMGVEYKGVHISDEKTPENKRQTQVGEISYGFTNRLSAGFEYQGERSSGTSLQKDAAKIESRYEIFEANEAFINTAFFAEYEHALQDNDPDAFEFGLLGQKEFSKLIVRGNLYAAREVGPNRGHGIGFEARGYTISVA